jgi:formate hydrogenlyase subunit 6/NADH:ubiquinone oxidoreductase subunit I
VPRSTPGHWHEAVDGTLVHQPIGRFAEPREIARHAGTSARPIRAGVQPSLRDRAALCIVFPAYLAPLSGVPLIVERFVATIPGIRWRRIYLVCTCGGYELVNAVPALKSLKRTLHRLGGRPAGEYSVRMPMNNLDYDHIPVPIERSTEKIVAKSVATVEEIAARILSGRPGKHHFARSITNALLTPMHLALRRSCIAALERYAGERPGTAASFRELIPRTDRAILVDDRCTGCGTCAKVCPAGNIRMIENAPRFGGTCEMCFGCDEWCPANAIHHWGRAQGVKYHHPAVTVRDMTGDRRSRPLSD